MPLVEQDTVDVKRIFSKEENKNQIGHNDGCAKLEGPYREVIRNPEKGGDMDE
jgi:hypothetical protein